MIRKKNKTYLKISNLTLEERNKPKAQRGKAHQSIWFNLSGRNRREAKLKQANHIPKSKLAEINTLKFMRMRKSKISPSKN